MKALAATLALFIATLTMNANGNGILNKGKEKKNTFREAVTRQINKHLFFITEDGQKVEGNADVMLQVMPEGDVHVVLIQTKNPLVKKFIENQVKKMKIDKAEVVTGQILKYRFVFKARN
ncbi:MAG: hypothetical protein ACKVOK_14625 [Flavobacteriales bacterium]